MTDESFDFIFQMPTTIVRMLEITSSSTTTLDLTPTYDSANSSSSNNNGKQN